MSRDRLRKLCLNSVDKLLDHQWMAGIDAEKKAVLLALRQLAVSDESFLDKLLALMGPTEGPTVLPDPR